MSGLPSVTLPTVQKPWKRAISAPNNAGPATTLCMIMSPGFGSGMDGDVCDLYISANDMRFATPEFVTWLEVVVLAGYTDPSSTTPTVADAWMIYWPGIDGGVCSGVDDNSALTLEACQVDENGCVTKPDQLWFMTDNGDGTTTFTSLNQNKVLMQSFWNGYLGVDPNAAFFESNPGSTTNPNSKFRIVGLKENPDLFKTAFSADPGYPKTLSGPYDIDPPNAQADDFDPVSNGMISFNKLDLSQTSFAGCSLNYVSFEECDLSKANFNGAKFLEYVSFEDCTFQGNDFSGCNLDGVSEVHFSYAQLQGMTLRGATMAYEQLSDGAKFDGLDLTNVTITDLPSPVSSKSNPLSAKGTTLQGFTGFPASGADLSYAVLTDAKMQGLTLKNALLIGADLTGANLQGCDLAGSDLTDATLDDCQMQAATLDGVKLIGKSKRLSMTGARLDTPDKTTRTSLQSAVLQDVNLDGAHLKNVLMNRAQFYGAANGIDLTDVDLSNSNLSGIDLSGTSLADGAHLYETVLDNANLVKAKLNYADLTHASLNGAYLQGADLTGAVLTSANLRSASVCLAYSGPQIVLGVPLFFIEPTDKLTQGLDQKDVKGAGLQSIFSDNNQNWENLGAPTLFVFEKSEGWILMAASATYTKVRNSQMGTRSGFLSYTLWTHLGKIFVFGRDSWCTATAVSATNALTEQQKAIYLQGHLFVPKGVTAGPYDITDVGETVFPEVLADDMYCPNGQTVAENNQAALDRWFWMTPPEAPQAPKCVANPPLHYCP